MAVAAIECRWSRPARRTAARSAGARARSGARSAAREPPWSSTQTQACRGSGGRSPKNTTRMSRRRSSCIASGARPAAAATTTARACDAHEHLDGGALGVAVVVGLEHQHRRAAALERAVDEPEHLAVQRARRATARRCRPSASSRGAGRGPARPARRRARRSRARRGRAGPARPGRRRLRPVRPWRWRRPPVARPARGSGSAGRGPWRALRHVVTNVPSPFSTFTAQIAGDRFRASSQARTSVPASPSAPAIE